MSGSSLGKRRWRHPAPSNRCVSTATSSDVPSPPLSLWVSSVVSETEKNRRFTRLNWSDVPGGCCVVMGGVRANTAASASAARASRLEYLKLERTTWVAIGRYLPPRHPHHQQVAVSRSAARRCSLSSGPIVAFSHPAARAAEWIPPCSSSCCTWWSRTSWSAAGCSIEDRAPSRASWLQVLCCAQGVWVCVRARVRAPAWIHMSVSVFGCDSDLGLIRGCAFACFGKYGGTDIT